MQLHLLSLSEDDRRARFGHSLTDMAVAGWCNRAMQGDSLWWGAWAAYDGGLCAALQLCPTVHEGVWEIGLSVAQPLRRRGLGTALLGDALRHLPQVRQMVCHHGHPAIVRMALRLGCTVQTRENSPGLRLIVSPSEQV
ncbi:MAG: GNAT family N-acetyltransferase [Tepidimonas sp.]|uniref:GNAT family N-acetyltransferase n=1 Tax=Tepidimonas sp. TaxID=2002775 RepID=UPI00259FB747|nr:GNAT family N-acetyltransferase [Tepidimonas sp.]MDM7456262.1 GNAT family N-acetyltransferase [Tepidimonas sp.]